MTEKQLQILQHSLGADKYGQGEMYRNHFCAGEDDETICRELVELGYMRVFHPNQSPLPYFNCSVTEEGKSAMLRESPQPPKFTRAQERYREFLNADSGVSFREWLRWKEKARAAPDLKWLQSGTTARK
jgi:hypothetical protein